MEEETLCWIWLITSLVATLGALRPPGRRLRFYFAYAFAWITLLILCPISLSIVDQSVRYRWVSTYFGKPEPQEWHQYRVDGVFYWQIPVMMLIANPTLVLLAIRLFRAGRVPPDE